MPLRRWVLTTLSASCCPSGFGCEPLFQTAEFTGLFKRGEAADAIRLGWFARKVVRNVRALL